ncbi:hypothetical protein [Actinoplanes sp. NPDC049118]|uniref:hypothetical protein n=1 Tax=Actinoplanes sp. NPDC049118 TaxID=3155769 RepID=UPI0034081DB1
MNLRRVAIATATVATAVAVLVPTAASAASDEPGSPTCKLSASRARETVDLVSGTGRVENRRGCGGAKIYVSIERSRFFGWEQVSRAEVPTDHRDYTVTYDCRGTGTHDYRITIMPQANFQEAVSSLSLRGVQCSSR